MKNVEERLKMLPQIAESTGLQADEQLKRKILRAAESKKAPRKTFLYRWAPALCALMVLLGTGTYFLLPRIVGGASSSGPRQTDLNLIFSQTAGVVVSGAKRALDVPTGSVTIRDSRNPSRRSIWENAVGANFPLVAVNGRYYRMLTNPTSIPSSMLGTALGAVDIFTSEPALAGNRGVISNIVNAGETVYAVRGMEGAVAAANVNGQMRVFQRVSFGDRALVDGEGLADTLRANGVVALELSGVGTISNAATAQYLVGILTNNAHFLQAGGGETDQSLLIQLSNGITLQMAVNNQRQRLFACGTWACPEFFDAFLEALQ